MIKLRRLDPGLVDGMDLDVPDVPDAQTRPPDIDA